MSDELHQESAVDIDGGRCWFMAKDLVKTLPRKWIHFFRSDVLHRWQLEPDDTCSLTGDPEELVGLLRDRFGFAKRRAEAEVDDFYTAFNQKMACATESSSVMPPGLFGRPQLRAEMLVGHPAFQGEDVTEILGLPEYVLAFVDRPLGRPHFGRPSSP